MTARCICIVTPGHLASNPRVVKEANALQQAGFDVRVVAGDLTPAVRPFDQEVIGAAPWSVRRVGRGGMPSRVAHRLARRATRIAPGRIPLWLATLAQSEHSVGLARAATEIPADLYIAHYVAGLAAASAAARHNKTLVSYDAEDFHAGEAGNSASDPSRAVVMAIERPLLAHCVHVTAASPLIGAAYRELYGVRAETVLNVFPLEQRPRTTGPRSPAGMLRLFWFSQTVGLDRGLQAIIEGMVRARARISLDILGSDQWGHGACLLQLADRLGLGGQVGLRPTVSPDSLPAIAAEYDIGLSMETNVSESRQRCLTNKIFVYLLAGIPVLMSDTPAQRLLADDLGKAAAVVPLADPAAIGVALDRWAYSVDERRLASNEAARLSQERYNWDHEKGIFLKLVDAALSSRMRQEQCPP